MGSGGTQRSKTLRSKLAVILRQFYFLQGFRNRLGDITLTKTFSENIEYPLYIEQSVVSYLEIKSKSTLFLCKQLRSSFSSQSCLYFQVFGGSMLLNGCLVVWPMSARNTVIFKIKTRYLWSVNLKFSQQCFWIELCCIVGVTAILHLLQRKASTFLWSIDSIVALWNVKPWKLLRNLPSED